MLFAKAATYGAVSLVVASISALAAFLSGELAFLHGKDIALRA